MNNPFSNLDSFVLEELKNGIFLKYIDIIFGKYFIYAITPQNILHPCIIYTYILSSREYKSGIKPKIHFCNCDLIWGTYDKNSTILKAKIPNKNSFDYKVRTNNSDMKLFYAMPLEFCNKCIGLYENIFLKFIDNKNMNFWNLLWSNKSVLKIEQLSIEDNLMLNSDFCHMKVNILENKSGFILNYKG